MTDKKTIADKQTECFVIMPIAEVDGYPDQHFKHVYDDIIAPSCLMANVKPIRADEVKATNLIHLDILKRLIETPIAICDLSTRNPNVMFELGIRQAFDKPVVLMQESGTPRIFDISPLRYLEYSRDMKYHDVVNTQKKLSEAITATMDADGDVGSVNSIVKLMALIDPAKIPDLKGNKDTVTLEFLRAEMSEIRRMLRATMNSSRLINGIEIVSIADLDQLGRAINRSASSIKTNPAAGLALVNSALDDLHKKLQSADNQHDYDKIKKVIENGEQTRKRILIEMDDDPFA